MRSRWLSTFSVLGILLIVLGIVGKIIGPRFVYDPGQIAGGNEAYFYLAVGALMLMNGLISPAQTPEEKKAESAARTPSSPPAGPRAVVTAAAEKRSGDNV